MLSNCQSVEGNDIISAPPFHSPSPLHPQCPFPSPLHPSLPRSQNKIMIDDLGRARKRNYRTETGFFFAPEPDLLLPEQGENHNSPRPHAHHLDHEDLMKLPVTDKFILRRPEQRNGGNKATPPVTGTTTNDNIEEETNLFPITKKKWGLICKQLLTLLLLQVVVYLLILGVDSLYRQWSQPQMRVHPVSKQPEVYTMGEGTETKEGGDSKQQKQVNLELMRCQEGNGLQCYPGMHTPVQSLDSDRIRSSTVLSISRKTVSTGSIADGSRGTINGVNTPPNEGGWEAKLQDTTVEDDDTRFQVMVSVVMPCYGHIHHIQESIESVVRQTYHSWELLVVDDASPDQCGEYVEELKKQQWPNHKNIHILVLSQNGGAAAARNAGITFAKGKWISCLDGDDTIRSDYFEEAMKLSTRDPSVNLIYSDQLYYREEFKPANRFGDWIVPEYSAQRVLLEGPWPTMSLFRRTLWVSSGGFEPQMPWGSEDWVFWISISRHALVPRKLHAFMVFYRFKETSKMRKKERYPEFLPIMHTLFPDLYTPSQLMKDHEVIGRTMHIDTMSYLRQKIMKRFKTKSMPYFWLGLVEEYKGEPSNAVRMYERCITLGKEAIKRDESNSDVHLARVNWQPYWRLIRLCSNPKVKNDCVSPIVADAITQLMRMRPDFQGQMIHVASNN
eukprot:TRINITY_DN1205_c0_g1_i10.p1 TRINITY_DN1205_c0_g1~~TRINITY_DN1205_c0_g1_i10.p1  ORF type:complete len:672 (-),score=141.72 TRINITY_DN1205_c0_g1_i10:95-2110(-)